MDGGSKDIRGLWGKKALKDSHGKDQCKEGLMLTYNLSEGGAGNRDLWTRNMCVAYCSPESQF